MTPIDWNDAEPMFPDFLPPSRENPTPLTGRRRFKITSEGLVLQVEYSKWSDVYMYHIYYWRDACSRDITPAETIIK